MTQQGIGFLGAGQMASALARGWVFTGLCNVEQSLASDPFATSRQTFQSKTGITATENNLLVVERNQIVVLAVKPQNVAVVLREIAPAMTADHLLISIAAGVKIAQMAELLPTGCKIVRVMPNTPCLVGASATAFACNELVTTFDKETVTELFAAVGKAFAVAEHQLDAVTGLSGSGPAYGYLMIEALADGGVRCGLPRDVSLMLAAQTVLGAAKMVLETMMHPGALKDAVASPGGTTIAGLHALEKAGVRGALIDAVVAATERSKELGKNAG
ncbi:MAG: pyrroline-5-carboxylate reductase [Zavarzinella sp.]